ncbi:MAG: pre-peptidase C-terminal domain-containing protein [Hyphomonadaceae bacterium]|nr:pre-peptidase C-terminal domain-containing protein [Hyphomonadaceae bacterium]
MRGKLFFGAAAVALLMGAPALAQTDPSADANTTSSVRDGATVDGEINPAGDGDWYRLRVEQGRRYSLTLEGVPNAEGLAVDPVLSVYDAAGNQLAFNDDANGLNSALTYVASQSGDVFVEARAYSEGETGQYRLAVASTELPADDAGNDAGTRSRLNIGRAVNGQLEYEGDVDWYRLSARTGTRYSVTLNGSGDPAVGDTYLRVVDSDGNEIAANDDAEGLNSALQFTVRENTEVFIEASAYANAYTGGYALNVTSERVPDDGLAANRNTRGRITLGQDVNGSLETEGDQDWYRLRLEAGQTYRFALRGEGDTPVGDPLLRVHNAQGEDIAVDDDGGGNLNSYLEFSAPSTGTYFIAAQAFADAYTGNYTLSARAGDIPGDTSTDASLSSAGDYREGNLSPAGDRDWYRIELAQGEGVRVGLNSAEGAADALGDPYLVFYDANGTELLRDDDGGEGLNAWAEFVAPTAGAYYIEARGFGEDAAGRYSLMLVAGEVGDSAEGAEYVQAGFEGRVSTIGAAGDVDWFVLEAIEGRTYRYYVDGWDDGTGNTLADPLLVLYDQQGQEIARDDDGGVGLNSYLTHVPVTGGPYFLAVSSYDGQSTGRYSLRAVDTDVPGHAYTDEILDQAGDERVSRIDIEGDLDSFRVDLEGGVTYTITVSGHGERPLADPFVAVVLEDNSVLGSDDDSGPGRDARLRFTPEQSGSYLIQASGLGGTIGWYQVTIARQ